MCTMDAMSKWGVEMRWLGSAGRVRVWYRLRASPQSHTPPLPTTTSQPHQNVRREDNPGTTDLSSENLFLEAHVDVFSPYTYSEFKFKMKSGCRIVVRGQHV